jgi:DNA-binding transcriptional MerR regulator
MNKPNLIEQVAGRGVSTSRKPQDRVLKIGELAKLSGVGIETLRFYERQGLMDVITRTESGYRLYQTDALERLEFIKRAQMLGLSLAEIGEIIREKQAGNSPCAHVRSIVRRRLEEVEQRMREMKRYRKELATALAEWERAGDTEGRVCGHIEGTRLKHSPSIVQRIPRKGSKS